MKKLFTIICLLATVYSASAQKKIAYVTTAAAMSTDPILTALTAAGSAANWTVTAIDVVDVSTVTPANYDMVVLSEWPGSAAAGVIALEGVNLPMLFMKSFALKSTSWNWTTSGQGTGYDQTIDATIGVTVTNTSHPIFAGVTTSGTVNLITAPGPAPKGLTWANPALFTSVTGGTIVNIANIAGDATKQCIFEVPAGTTVSGTLLQQKLLQIGINQDAYANVSSDGLKIIGNACTYLLATATGIQYKNSTEHAFSVAPNPSNGVFKIDFGQALAASNVEVKSMDGRLVYAGAVNADAMDVNLSHLQAGVYFVSYIVNNTVNTKRIVIK
jgi:hypothetical protein